MIHMNKPISLLAALLPFTALANYDINFEKDATIANKGGRALSSVAFNGSSVAVNQASSKRLYFDLHDSAIFTAEAGQEVTPAMEWSGTWMHGYLYIDLNQDGRFSPASELISYSYLGARNSIGQTAAGDCGVTLPPFVVPGLKAGDYRMRYVVDWDSNDPGGRTEQGNTIVDNAGAIVDATLRVTGSSTPAAEPLAINFSKTAQIAHATRRLHNINFGSQLTGVQVLNVGQDTDKLLYHNLTEAPAVNLLPNQPINVTFDWTGVWMNSYIYIDRNGDGEFSAQLSTNGTPLPGTDLVAFSHLSGKNSNGGTLSHGDVLNAPSFVLPGELRPGKYTMRVKIDWDSADPKGSKTEGNTIVTNGGAIVDLTINVLPESTSSVAIRPQALNGQLFLANGALLPESIVSGLPLAIKAVPTLPGFETDSIIVRHNNIDTSVALNQEGIAVIPDSIVNSDLEIFALFKETNDSEWTKIWGDEFSSDKMDTRRWSYHPRYGATWNRLIANTLKEQKLVNVFADGCYNAYCIPTPEEFTAETQPMISGAIYSAGGKFTVKYGKIEARLKTNPHIGNFPAFWMMPVTDPGWPRGGEIDIWEQIDTANQSHHTVHSGWTGWRAYLNWPAPGKNSPTSTAGIYNDATQWHVYAIEWDAEEIRWYVDGRQVFSYRNQHYSEEGTNYTADITWPFNKEFYIILNQSVGNGSWAKNPDTSFTYLTQFDYVRVYQKKKDGGSFTRQIKNNGDDPDFYTPLTTNDIKQVTEEAPDSPIYFDLQGRRVANPTKGLYINSGKVVYINN